MDISNGFYLLNEWESKKTKKILGENDQGYFLLTLPFMKYTQ